MPRNGGALGESEQLEVAKRFADGRLAHAKPLRDPDFDHPIARHQAAVQNVVDELVADLLAKDALLRRWGGPTSDPDGPDRESRRLFSRQRADFIVSSDGRGYPHRIVARQGQDLTRGIASFQCTIGRPGTGARKNGMRDTLERPDVDRPQIGTTERHAGHPRRDARARSRRARLRSRGSGGTRCSSAAHALRDRLRREGRAGRPRA